MSSTEVRWMGDKLPSCEFCGKEASYDAKTIMRPWAYLCLTHFKKYGIGLGLGKGQKLVLKAPIQAKF